MKKFHIGIRLKSEENTIKEKFLNFLKIECLDPKTRQMKCISIFKTNNDSFLPYFPFSGIKFLVFFRIGPTPTPTFME